MKIISAFLVLAALLASTSCTHCDKKACPANEAPMDARAAAMRQTHDFIKNAGHYFIATVDKDQPHVRPFGTIHIFEGRLYIQTGRKKKVGRQLKSNGKIELCAMKDDKWIRLSGTVAEDPRHEAKSSMLDAYPSLKKIYSPDDDNTMVLFFVPGTATATIYSYGNNAAPVELKF